MKKLLLGLIAGVVIASPKAAPHATHVTVADVEATVARMPADRVSDLQIRMVDAGGYNVGVGVVRRPAGASGGAIQHDKLTEMYYVLEGSGTLVTGGTMTDARVMNPEGATVRQLAGPSSSGSGIEGGHSQRIGPGDIVIIPQDVAHWFSDVEATITYLVFRVDPEQVLPEL